MTGAEDGEWLYANDHRVDCGIYIVLSFGNIPSKGLSKPPPGIVVPKTPDDLRVRLEASSASTLQGRVRIVVLDLVRPGGPGETAATVHGVVRNS